MIGDNTNLMSADPLPNTEGKYGFALQAKQIMQIKDYFGRGKTYKLLEQNGFDFIRYIDYISKNPN